ncbi:hypothetical protein [Duganella radicis]|uniref:CPBP family intramembrane metalloprotease n=1 Tax=Duganella radicis TaxID=551988 RepID=A0A6L6PMG4_9BURK|nr:hypothetical protein [Duganella radicis]MTV39315.1 hypothetical protein [Duganella radicis]
MRLESLATQKKSLLNFCCLSFPLALIPSTIFYILASSILRWTGTDLETIKAPEQSLTSTAVAFTILVGPALETLILALIIRLILIFTKRKNVVAAVSALLVAGIHGTIGPLWFFGTVWTFFVLSSGYLIWREESFLKACTAALIPHMLINTTVVLATTAASLYT